MIVRVTNRFGKWLGVEPSVTLKPHENPLLDWSANSFGVDGKCHVIFTNSASLLTIVFDASYSVDAAAFMDEAAKVMRHFFRKHRMDAVFERHFAKHLGTTTFSKIGNPSLNASMGDILLRVEDDIYRGLNVVEATFRANDLPVLKLKGATPLERFTMHIVALEEVGPGARIKFL